MSYISRTPSASVWSFYDPFRAERGVRSRGTTASAEMAKGPAAAEVRGRLISSATALRNAFNSLSQNLRRITMPTLEGSAGSKAVARARIVPASTFSLLQGTQEINATASAVRSSANSLGLDVATPEALSVLESSGGIGLDLAERSSMLDGGALGLDTTTPESASIIQSTEEANTTATSYGVLQAAFNNGQTSLGNLSGAYKGTGAAANATSLTLTVTSSNGTMGTLLPSSVSLQVTDQNGTNLGTFSGLLWTGTELSLGPDIGLSIAFTSGSLRTNASTTFAVSATNGTDVDPTAIFNASNINNRPRFENGATVGAGSFRVNGTAVQVFANDSVNSVLQRINSTVAGVVASYQNDRVVIRSSGPSEDNITLSNDTSGFFAALKLNGASAVAGNVRDDLQVFSKTSQFGSLATGSFQVNGQTISLNRSADNLQTIITKINNSGAGVTAAYDSVNDRITLESNDPSEDPIVVGNDTTGFLSVAGLSTNNTVAGNLRDDRQNLADVPAFAGVINGSFRVNGTQISLNAAIDTLETVLARINASVPGIQASYDSAHDKLIFASAENSEDDIVLSDDTSGFLSAIQLDGATTTRGNIRDDEQALKGVAQFAGVAAGSFQVNGVTITVDPATDSLNSILAQINASSAGVSAAYDPALNRVVLDPGTNPLALENDTSGFLDAIEIAPGTSATRVNATGAFNGTGLNGPQFEDGVSVRAGSFTVNGVEITVQADDSVQNVLDKITASGAGVTAIFNPVTEMISLRAKQSGLQPISLTNDTSGFLAAVKLDGTASFTTGNVGNEMFLRETVPGSIAGTIQINNRTISVDPDSDSITTLVQKLDALEGVEAFLDNSTGALTIRSETEGDSVTISDSTGVLRTLGIEDGTYTGQAATFRTLHSKISKFQVNNRDQVVDRIVESFDTLNEALETVQQAAGLTLAFRDDIQDAVRDSFAAIRDARSKGLRIVNEASSPATVRIERSLLSNAIRQNARVLENLYKGENSLTDVLEDLADEAQANFLATPEQPVALTPGPAAVAAEVAGDFYKVSSASQLFIIDSMTTAVLTPSEASPEVDQHEPNPAGDMESSRGVSRASG
jgi:hypothetical protein